MYIFYNKKPNTKEILQKHFEECLNVESNSRDKMLRALLENEKEATSILYKAIQKGGNNTPLYMYLLAHCFEHGVGTEGSISKANEYYKLAADQGNVPAAYRLGEAHSTEGVHVLLLVNSLTSESDTTNHLLEGKGLGLEKSLEKAVYYFKLAADQNDADASFRLGECYEQSAGKFRSKISTKEAISQAFHYYRQAADLSPAYTYVVAKCHEKGIGLQQSPETAIYYYTLAIKYDYNLAPFYCYKIGNCYQTIQGNESKAIHFFQQAAHADSALSIYGLSGLAEAYRYGKGVQQSYAESFKYFDALLERYEIYKPVDLPEEITWHLENAARTLAHYYRFGLAYEKSEEKAQKYAELENTFSSKKDSVDSGSSAVVDHHIEEPIDIESAPLTEQKEIEYYDLGKSYESAGALSDALRHYTLSACGGYSKAQHRLGDAYLKGELGLNLNPETAVLYYALAASQNEPNSLRMLGQCHERGEGIVTTPRVALYYYKLANELENQQKSDKKSKDVTSHELEYELGKSYEDSGNFSEAFEHYALSAASGFVQAQKRLGDAYLKGELLLDPSPKEAFSYYQRAAHQSDLYCLDRLGECYLHGIGIEQSFSNAFQCYKQIAEVDHQNGYDIVYKGFLKKISFENIQLVKQENDLFLSFFNYLLANKLCKNGMGSTIQLWDIKDKGSNTDAFNYYKASADNGFSKAQKRLGDIFLNGELGLEKSIERAVFYYALAASQQDPSALIMLGKCFEEGTWVNLSKKKAFYYYKRAAEFDSSYASEVYGEELARCYEKGIGTTKSLEKAIECYQSMVSNHPDKADSFFYSIGHCYSKFGIKEADEKAAEYYHKAAAAYYHQAIFNIFGLFELAESFRMGRGVEQSWEKAFRCYRLIANQDVAYAPCSDEEKILKTVYERLVVCYRLGLGCEKSALEVQKYISLRDAI